MSAIEDKWAIHELVGQYCFCVDNRRWTGLRALLTDDAEWIAAPAHAKTGDEVIDLMSRLIPPATDGADRKIFVSNLVIKLDGDTATAESNFVVMRKSPQGVVPSIVGTYLDELRKENGAWRFRRRDVVHDFVTDSKS